MTTQSNDAKQQQQALEAVFQDLIRTGDTPHPVDEARLAAAVHEARSSSVQIQEYLLARTKPDTSLRYR